MCTLIVLHRCVPGRPLVVAANRDEFYARPAEGPAVRDARRGRVLAPRDLEAGGTWLGLSERGVFAGLTNLRPAAPSGSGMLGGDAGRRAASAGATTLRSRGEVVMSALEARSAAEASEALARLEPGVHNPFQLLVADGQDAALVVYRDGPRVVALEPGIHVVGNVEDECAARTSDRPRGPGPADASSPTGSANEGWTKPYPGFEGIDGLDDAEEPRAQKLVRIRGRVEKLLTEPRRDLFEGLARICREHVEEDGPREPGVESSPRSPFESTCVHVADRYGTRSSLLLELAEELPASRLWTTDGPPCRRPFENRSSLLWDLGIAPRTRVGTETMRG
ncbi:MAG: NRDE family protein [Myxococcota bacterium]